MFNKLTNATGAMLSMPLDFIKGAGNVGWKVGLAVGGVLLGMAAFGIGGVTLSTAIGGGMLATLVGGVVGGGYNVVKEFMTSDAGKKTIQDGMEHVVEQSVPGRPKELSITHGLGAASAVDQRDDLQIGG